MTNTFANICKGDISSKNIHDPWNILINTFLEKKVFDKNLMLDLLSKARFDKILNLFEYLAFLKKTLTFAIFAKNEDCLIKKQLLDYFENTTYNILFEKYHLVKILRKLIYLILKDENLKKFKIKDEKLLSSLAIDNLSKSFNLQLLSDLSSALLLLGILTKNKKYLNKSYSLTTFLSNFLDHKNRFFEIIGQSEKFYKISSLYSSLYQNFYFNGTIFQNPNFLEIAQNCLKKIDFSKVSFFYITINDFLANNIVKNKPLEITENYKSYFIDKDTETFIFRKKSFSSIASFKTFNSSLGSFHFNNILIPAIGPQTDNLFDCSNFGVFSSNPKSNFKIKNNSYNFNKWLKIISKTPIWMKFQNIFKNDEVLLKIKFTEIPIKTNLFFNFYIKAADAFFDSENHLKKSTIFKYFGINKKTFFKQGDETISIECQNVTNMHLIPLAGKDSFWDSDFLLSFEVKEGKNSLSIMIKQNNFL